MTSILGGVSGFDFQRATVLAGIQRQFNQRVAEKTAVINSDYAAKIGSVQRDDRKWTGFRDDLEDARTVVSGAVDRLKAMMSMVDSVIQTVNRAEQDEDIDINHEGYQSTFDSLLKSIRGRADGSSDTPNLLGNTGARELSVPLTPSGAVSAVRQNYMGTSYSIVDSEGKLWRPDYSGNLLRRYESYPDEPTSISGNLAGGVRPDAISGTDITLTVAPGTAGETQYAGTLTVDGNGAMDAWYYDSLATADGRQRAIADMETVRATLKAQVSHYSGLLTAVDYRHQRASSALKDSQKDTIALMLEQEKAAAKAQKEGQRQLNAVADALAHNQAMSGLFVNMMGMFTIDSGTGQLAGRSTAARIFGAFVDMGV